MTDEHTESLNDSALSAKALLERALRLISEDRIEMAAGWIRAVIRDMGDASTRKDEAASIAADFTSPANLRCGEIPVVDEDLRLLLLDYASVNYEIGFADAKGQPVPDRMNDKRDEFYIGLTRILKRAIKPVSLVLCAKALWDCEHEGRQNEVLAVEWSLLSDDYSERVKAVLDAAGVKYHE